MNLKEVCSLESYGYSILRNIFKAKNIHVIIKQYQQLRTLLEQIYKTQFQGMQYIDIFHNYINITTFK